MEEEELVEDLGGAVDGQLRHALRHEPPVGGELRVDRLDRRLVEYIFRGVGVGVGLGGWVCVCVRRAPSV